MLAMISLDYNARDKLAKTDRQTWERLRSEIPQLGLTEWKEGANEAPQWFGSYNDLLVDLTSDGVLLASLGLEYQVKRFKNTYRAATAEANGASYHLHVAIPNVGLLAMDEVQLLSDACTDSLQGELNDGWRIIAVCPPNAQRRPDYILGRTKGGA